MNSLALILRWLADKCGGETDLDFRARLLGVTRGYYPGAGSRWAIEQAISDRTPVGKTIEFSWHERDGAEVLMVRFR